MFVFGVRPLYASIVESEGRVERLAERSEQTVCHNKDSQADVVCFLPLAYSVLAERCRALVQSLTTGVTAPPDSICDSK
jgi:hypothetical protein